MHQLVGDGGFDELRRASVVGMQAIKVTWYLGRKQLVEADILTVSDVRDLIRVLNENRF